MHHIPFHPRPPKCRQMSHSNSRRKAMKRQAPCGCPGPAPPFPPPPPAGGGSSRGDRLAPPPPRPQRAGPARRRGDCSGVRASREQHTPNPRPSCTKPGVSAAGGPERNRSAAVALKRVAMEQTVSVSARTADRDRLPGSG